MSVAAFDSNCPLEASHLLTGVHTVSRVGFPTCLRISVTPLQTLNPLHFRSLSTPGGLNSNSSTEHFVSGRHLVFVELVPALKVYSFFASHLVWAKQTESDFGVHGSRRNVPEGQLEHFAHCVSVLVLQGDRS